MQVTLTRNIGTDDIKRFGLDKFDNPRKQLVDGATVNVSDASAKLLLDEGLAEPSSIKAPARETEIKAPAK